MTQFRYPYNDTHQCLVMVHSGHFAIVYPDREEPGQAECRPDQETIWDVLHQDEGMIASGSSCCSKHAFMETREIIDRHQAELERKVLGKPIRISEADRRNRQVNRLARTAQTQDPQPGLPITVLPT